MSGLTLRTLELLALVNRSHGRAVAKERAAEVLGVDDRTVRRYVKALSTLANTDIPGCPVTLPDVEMQLREGRSYVVLRHPPATLSEIYQYAAVYTAISHLTAVEDEILGASALDALADRFGVSRDSDVVNRVRRGFYYRPLAPKRYDADQVGILEDIILGIVFCHPLELHYRSLSATQPRKHPFKPYTLVMFRDGFYVLGATAKGMMLAAVDRVSRVRVLRKKTFTVPEDFEPEVYFEGGFGIWRVDDPDDLETITLAFDDSAARTAMERDWPGEVSWDELADGRQMLTLRQAITDTFVAWLLGWGSRVEILAPDSLRTRVRNELLAALELYIEWDEDDD